VRSFSDDEPHFRVRGSDDPSTVAPAGPEAPASDGLPDEDGKVGQLVAGSYRLLRRIGEGGSSDVYEARREPSGERLAIKIARADGAPPPEQFQRVVVEAQAASAVGHPGIVGVLDFGHLAGGEPYLVMELVEGEDLAACLRRERRLAPPVAVDICVQVLEALEAAHRAGVIHCDVKPQNVLLARRADGGWTARMTDFGLAAPSRLAQDAGPAPQLGTVVGTPHFMAPEQARWVGPLDARVDVYAAGVLLYRMLTGKLPYDGISVTEVLVRVLTEPTPHPRTVNPFVPLELEPVILRAMARRREDRYATAAEFAAALRLVRDRLALT
jgi:serine/threonine-protein kinase